MYEEETRFPQTCIAFEQRKRKAGGRGERVRGRGGGEAGRLPGSLTFTISVISEMDRGFSHTASIRPELVRVLVPTRHTTCFNIMYLEQNFLQNVVMSHVSSIN